MTKKSIKNARRWVFAAAFLVAASVGCGWTFRFGAGSVSQADDRAPIQAPRDQTGCWVQVGGGRSVDCEGVPYGDDSAQGAKASPPEPKDME